MPENQKSKFENVNDLIRATIWPFIALLVFIFYGAEIGRIIELIPKKIETSSKISVGSISFEIEKTAKSTGNEELAEIIKNLSEKGIRKLLALGSSRHIIMVRSRLFENGAEEDAYSIPRDIDIYKELEKEGLVTVDEPIDDFLNFYMKLNPIEEIRSESHSGSSTDAPMDLFNSKHSKFSLPVSKLNSKENERIDNYGVELSESGKKAFEIIIQVIAEQISNR